MSLPNSVSAPVEKQRTNIYTMMLILSFLMLVIGCILFANLWAAEESEQPWNTTAANPAPPAAVTAAPAAAPAAAAPAAAAPAAAAPAPAPAAAPAPAPAPAPMP